MYIYIYIYICGYASVCLCLCLCLYQCAWVGVHNCIPREWSWCVGSPLWIVWRHSPLRVSWKPPLELFMTLPLPINHWERSRPCLKKQTRHVDRSRWVWWRTWVVKTCKWVPSSNLYMSQIARQAYMQTMQPKPFKQDGYGGVPGCWARTPSGGLPSSYLPCHKHHVKRQRYN